MYESEVIRVSNENRNAYMREYMKEYREKNRERINAQRREWARNNPDRVKAHQEKYWDKKIKEKQKEGVN